MKKHVKEIILILSAIVCAVIVLKYSRAVVVSMRQNRLGVETESVAETVSENTYANSKGCRITYADGYYYYASQLDHYYLYRVKEDGSEAVCLAKVHSGTIQVDGDCIYFVNLSDHNAIYRIGTNGSGMVKLCDSSDNHMQLTEEYIYFRSAYEKEWDIHGLVSVETDAAAYYGTDDCLYRMHKDGSEKELLLINVGNCILAPVSGSEIKYEGYIYCGKSQQNETTGQNETHVMVYDLDGNSIGEVCRFDFKGDILVCGGRIYCCSPYEENGKICMYTTWNKEMIILPDKMLIDCCIYKGSLYGLTEEIDKEKRITQIFRLSPDTEEWQMVYSNNALCAAADGHGVIDNRGSLADFYATEQGVFLRQFVSSKEGGRWFAVGEEKGAISWEDETQIPITQPAFELDHTGELSSIKSDFHSTDNYEEYLVEDLTYEAFYSKDYEGEDCNPYTIRLPQFNEKIAGYRQINQYFQNAYQESMEILQAEFVEMLDEEEKETGYLSPILYEGTAYDYVYIGEKYITVAMFQHGYSGGGRTWAVEKPVTFERDTGKVVSLEDLYRMPTDDVVAQTTAMVYKYMETIGRGGGTGSHGNGNFFLKDGDILTERYDPKQFFLFPEGIGFYYQKYNIDCGAAGDYLFIVPFADS